MVVEWLLRHRWRSCQIVDEKSSLAHHPPGTTQRVPRTPHADEVSADEVSWDEQIGGLRRDDRARAPVQD
jgi:hypothetical protein